MYDQFIIWLDGTSLSQLFKATDWLVPAVQSIHILAIGVVFSSSVILLLRVAALSPRDVQVTALNQRLLPWIWWSLLVLLVSGILLIITEPGRALTNPFFFAKMILVAIFAALARYYQVTVRNAPLRWNDVSAPRPGVRPVSAIVLLILLAIVFCGRWIAYYNV
jgi:uncharacterized membrane protein SirB2